MFEDLRNSVQEPNEPEKSPFIEETKEGPQEPFLGMTAPQRFVIVLLLFMMTCVLGSGCLILTGKVLLPIF